MSVNIVDCIDADMAVQIAAEHVGYYMDDIGSLVIDDVVRTMQDLNIPDAQDYLQELHDGSAVENFAEDFGMLPEVIALGRAYIKAVAAVSKQRTDAGLRA